MSACKGAQAIWHTRPEIAPKLEMIQQSPGLYKSERVENYEAVVPHHLEKSSTCHAVQRGTRGPLDPTALQTTTAQIFRAQTPREDTLFKQLFLAAPVFRRRAFRGTAALRTHQRLSLFCQLALA